MTTLRDRCQEMICELNRSALVPGASPADDLLGFVLSEKGRDADPSLADTLPMILYFANDVDREAFRAIYQEMHPNVRQVKLP